MSCPMHTNFTSSTDRTFLATLESWFDDRRELLLMIRYPYAAGDREFEFFSSFQSLAERIRGLRRKTSIIAFRQPQLSLRGIVADAFIARCLSSIPDGSEYLVVETDRRVADGRSWTHDASGVSHAELRDDLEDCRSAPVAVGLYPNWVEDSNDVISAYVPDEDGIVRPGAY